ncbi:MAG: ROK family protein, partial [Candidatus Andersenbacteria bacterium]
TGIGGTRIIDGNIDRSSQGFEPGHHIIDPNGPQCGCGGIGHLEALASGTAVQKKYGKNPKEIKNPKIWDEVTKYLAIGLLNASMFWSPECIVLGGSMMRDISLENVEKYMKEYNFILPSLPILKKSELGDTGGLIGALQLACYNTEYGPLNRSTSL